MGEWISAGDGRVGGEWESWGELGGMGKWISG